MVLVIQEAIHDVLPSQVLYSGSLYYIESLITYGEIRFRVWSKIDDTLKLDTGDLADAVAKFNDLSE